MVGIVRAALVAALMASGLSAATIEKNRGNVFPSRDSKFCFSEGGYLIVFGFILEMHLSQRSTPLVGIVSGTQPSESSKILLPILKCRRYSSDFFQDSGKLKGSGGRKYGGSVGHNRGLENVF